MQFETIKRCHFAPIKLEKLSLDKLVVKLVHSSLVDGSANQYNM